MYAYYYCQFKLGGLELAVADPPSCLNDFSILDPETGKAIYDLGMVASEGYLHGAVVDDYEGIKGQPRGAAAAAQTLAATGSVSLGVAAPLVPTDNSVLYVFAFVFVAWTLVYVSALFVQSGNKLLGGTVQNNDLRESLLGPSPEV